MIVDNVASVFPIAIGAYKIEEKLEFKNIKSSNLTKIFSFDENNDYYASENKRILEFYPYEKNILYKYLNHYVKNTLNHKDSEFRISTSWLTKCKKNAYSHIHAHKNCYLTGVLFFDDCYDKETGFLQLYNPHYDLNSYQIHHTETNNYTCEIMAFAPENNFLVLFPSYIKHSVSLNTSDKDRYSLAFNIIPVGIYGYGDSGACVNCCE